MGYIPGNRKKAAARREAFKIGVVTQLAKSAFMLEINRGIHQATEELQEMGIQLLLKEGRSVDGEEQLAAIEALEREEVQGLAIMPVDCQEIREKLNYLIEERNIPVVTFNSDIVGTKRSCYVAWTTERAGKRRQSSCEKEAGRQRSCSIRTLKSKRNTIYRKG